MFRNTNCCRRPRNCTILYPCNPQQHAPLIASRNHHQSPSVPSISKRQRLHHR
ncbi:hypothetical protein CCUS01_12691 [Colletotrichum cuscutae]|uniref:Uncharacterized protein n=1 Tax=Colletotrichum cuscutae TaxID=1209917 RepID=A0AAI9XDS0_9PEZI|nr:hypothetical protein CCUS01_12691 [Colletotrichum cuscutae]